MAFSFTGKINPPVINRLLPPGPNNARNSEGDFIVRKDGSILFVYTHFVGEVHYDHEPTFLAGRISYDQGATWTKEDYVVLENEGGKNVMSVTLSRMSDESMAIFYSRKNSIEDCRARMRISHDEGITWGPAQLCIPEPGYYPVNNDRVVSLSNGRLILPAGRHEACIAPNGERAVGDRSTAMAFYSDDAGATWRRSQTILEAPEHSKNGFQEPGIVELKSGRLMMWIRTDMGSQFLSYSDDSGDTWSAAVPSNIISPLGPASIKRIPATGHLLLVWNDHENIDERRRGKRTPLSTAISEDEGKTWQHRHVLEDKNLDGYYCYTAIEFVEDRVLLSYCSGDQSVNTSGLSETSIAWFDWRWLYS